MAHRLSNPRNIGLILLTGVFILLIINLACIYAAFIQGSPFSFGWRFQFDRRFNYPSLYSFSLLLINVYLIYKLTRKYSPPNSIKVFFNTTGVLLAVIAIDKFLHLHNKIRVASYKFFDSPALSSPLRYLWLVPYFIIFGIGAMYIIRNSIQLPVSLKKQLMIAAAFYIFGAVFVEALGNLYVFFYKQADLLVMLIRTGEELCQMLGLVYLIYIISNYQRYLHGEGNIKQKF